MDLVQAKQPLVQISKAQLPKCTPDALCQAVNILWCVHLCLVLTALSFRALRILGIKDLKMDSGSSWQADQLVWGSETFRSEYLENLAN